MLCVNLLFTIARDGNHYFKKDACKFAVIAVRVLFLAARIPIVKSHMTCTFNTYSYILYLGSVATCNIKSSYTVAITISTLGCHCFIPCNIL